jgi:hypothetical protein
LIKLRGRDLGHHGPQEPCRRCRQLFGPDAWVVNDGRCILCRMASYSLCNERLCATLHHPGICSTV